MNKRFLVMPLFMGLVGIPVTAQDVSVNVSSFEAAELSAVPEIDGDLSDAAWANIPEIVIDRDGDGAGSAPTEAGDLEVTMKAAWDQETNALYFGFHVVDDIYTKNAGQGSGTSGNSYQSESLEFVINAENTGLEEHGEGSLYHAQYVIEFPPTLDLMPVGVFDLPVSDSFISMSVYEKIDGHFAPTVEDEFNLDDQYLESAGTIRALEDQGEDASWGDGFAVEWYWEVKIVPMAQLGNVSFTEEPSQVKELQPLDVIGIDPCVNDCDVFTVTRDGRKNMSGDPNGWNSSANLVGMILMPSQSFITDWSVF